MTHPMRIEAYNANICLTSYTFYLKDLENWNGTDRFHFNAVVSDQDLVEVSSL